MKCHESSFCSLFEGINHSPFFEMIRVDVGDTLRIKAVSVVGVWRLWHTQFNIYYLGNFVPLGYQTTAVPVQTTACSSWYCYWY
jgi:hypothetical protein